MQGYAVVGEAADGGSAIAAARSLKPEVMLLDIRLPDIDGFEVTRRLAGEGNRTTVVPIVDAKHDVFLSLPEPRRVAFHEFEAWLDWYTEWSRSSDATAQSDQG